MRFTGSLAFLVLSALPVFSATFGTVVTSSGAVSYSDVVLDEPRQRLYLVATAANRVDVYSLQSHSFLSPIRTDSEPVSVALSWPGSNNQSQYLYITAYGASQLDIVDLTKSTLAVNAKIALPAGPEGVAVGNDGRVLISTVGNGGQNVLLIYDPSQPSASALSNVAIAPTAPTPPTLPPPSGRATLSLHSKLLTTSSGNLIIGADVTSTSSANDRVIFVYEVASGTVLRARQISNLSNVLAVSNDGSRFMAGATLFDTQTLAIMAQENVANSPFPFPTGANFSTQNSTTQVNQGGSIFAPDGSVLYAAFNYAPVQVPAAQPQVTRLLYNDPDNLLITYGLQLPENLSGRMVISAAGDTIYALSQSGFITLPIGAVSQLPQANLAAQTVLVANDQCGVTAKQRTVQAMVNNPSRTRITVNVAAYSSTNTGVTGNNGGAGGVIIFPGPGGGGVVITGPGFPTPGGGTTTTTTTTSSSSTTTGPLINVAPNGNGAQLNVQYNPAAAKSLGTLAASDFLVQSPEAVNIPADIRVYQNNRNAEARGTILPIQQNISTGETNMDMIQDTARQKLYIANSGMNEIEVFDMKTQTFQTPIKVGQLPHSMTIGSDGVTMYVANTGGESISIINLDKQQVVDKVVFPPIPVNLSYALNYPQVIASSAHGPQFAMSNGTLWKIDGNQAVPRTLNPAVFGGTATTRTTTISTGFGTQSYMAMAATPAGEYVLLVTGAGNGYLYDADADDYTVAQSIFSSTQTGYVGPIAAGPQGKYFVVNGTLLNSSLTPIYSPSSGTTTGGFPGIGTPTSTATRQISAVAAIGANSYVQFTTPSSATGTAAAAAADAGLVEIHNATNGQMMGQYNALEGPASTVTGNRAVVTNPRTLVVDSAGQTAYALTTSGLQIIPLTQPAPNQRPAVNNGGVVNMASYQASAAPGALISIFGQNLATSASSSATTFPTVLGGTCVTLNNSPLPLSMTSAGQINAQVPVTLAAGTYSLVVRSIANQAAQIFTSSVKVTKYAPAVFVSSSGQAAIVFQKDGSYVNKDNPATRDQKLSVFATGLGVTHGGTIVTGQAVPASPLSTTDPVSVYFGAQGYSQAPVIVNWSGLVPGMVGIYQINVTVPGTHMKGDALPVSIKIGGISSPTTGPAVPTVALN